MTAPLVSVRGLTRVFDVSKPWLNRVIERLPKRVLTAASDVSFDVAERTTYALVGESGSGKSTIGKMIVGLLRPSEGTVEIDGTDIHGPDAARVRRDVQMIFQDPYASLNPRWRVGDIVAEPLAARGADTAGVAERLLEQVGLAAEDAGTFPHQFSGGQRQRICVARALASGPRLIVCDEPTSALDVSVQAQVLNLMSDLKDELGLTYVFISHDLTVVRHMADRIGVLYLGRLVEEAAPDDLFEAPQHPLHPDAAGRRAQARRIRPRGPPAGGRNPRPDRPAPRLRLQPPVSAGDRAVPEGAPAAGGEGRGAGGVLAGGGNRGGGGGLTSFIAKSRS